MSRVVPLTGATRADLPPPCVDCVFWQEPGIASDGGRKDVWVRAADRRGESFGRMMAEPGGSASMVQYGRSGLFPRARRLPAGPPSRDAALLSCAYLTGDDPAGTCERLVLEALADLQARGLPAVEAFALGYPEEVAARDRCLGHHTLFDRDMLERLGFAAVRGAGQVSLVRLELGGLERTRPLAERVGRRLRRLTPERRPAHGMG